LFFSESLSHGLGQVVQEIQERGVGPPEADDIDVISGGHGSFRRAGHGIVFFSDGAVAPEIFRNSREEFVGDAIGVFIEAVTA
jgi:hypothetical protein